jgi:hypothetical protein
MKKTFLVLLLALAAVSLFAQTQPRDKPASAQQPSPDLAALQTANNLAKYGYTSRTASALICAAEILLQVQTQPLGAKGEKSSEGSGQVSTPEFTPANLLADAKKYAAGDKTVLAWAAAVEKLLSSKTRGAVGGPRSTMEVLYGNSYITYQQGFRANELAEVVVSGNGATDLDLYIFDGNGNLIAYDEDYSDDCFASFVPAWTGTFIIQVQNRGRSANRFELYTN